MKKVFFIALCAGLITPSIIKATRPAGTVATLHDKPTETTTDPFSGKGHKPKESTSEIEFKVAGVEETSQKAETLEEDIALQQKELWEEYFQLLKDNLSISFFSKAGESDEERNFREGGEKNAFESLGKFVAAVIEDQAKPKGKKIVITDDTVFADVGEAFHTKNDNQTAIIIVRHITDLQKLLKDSTVELIDRSKNPQEYFERQENALKLAEALTGIRMPGPGIAEILEGAIRKITGRVTGIAQEILGGIKAAGPVGWREFMSMSPAAKAGLITLIGATGIGAGKFFRGRWLPLLKRFLENKQVQAFFGPTLTILRNNSKYLWLFAKELTKAGIPFLVAYFSLTSSIQRRLSGNEQSKMQMKSFLVAALGSALVTRFYNPQGKLSLYTVPLLMASISAGQMFRLLNEYNKRYRPRTRRRSRRPIARRQI